MASVGGLPSPASNGNVNETLTQNTSGIGNQNTSSTGAANATGTSAQQNTYQPWQTGLQAQAGQAAGNFLQTGNLPGTFGAPPQVTQAYIDNFNRSVAPQLAAQYGAGSPAIGSQLALGLEQLQAQVYQNQSANFSNALNTAGGLAFQSVGQTGQQNQAQTENQKSNTNWQSTENTVSNLRAAASNTSSAFTWP